MALQILETLGVVNVVHLANRKIDADWIEFSNAMAA